MQSRRLTDVEDNSRNETNLYFKKMHIFFFRYGKK